MPRRRVRPTGMFLFVYFHGSSAPFTTTAPTGPNVNSRGRQPTVGRAPRSSALKGPNSSRASLISRFAPSRGAPIVASFDRGLTPTAIHIAALRAAEPARRAAMLIARGIPMNRQLRRSAMSHFAPPGLADSLNVRARDISLLAEQAFGMVGPSCKLSAMTRLDARSTRRQWPYATCEPSVFGFRFSFGSRFSNFGLSQHL
jgi:hypothetical protein